MIENKRHNNLKNDILNGINLNKVESHRLGIMLIRFGSKLEAQFKSGIEKQHSKNITKIAGNRIINIE